MDPSDIIRLLHTDHYAPANLEEVNDLCRNYPEFNLAHMLKVRIRASLGQESKKDLNVAAVYASDRRKLYELVTGGKARQVIPETKTEEPEEASDGIIFSDEANAHADVIIEQHAPYAVPEAGAELLELEDEPDTGDSFILDDSDEDLSSETLIQAMVKGESDMEEPDTRVSETPAIDQVEKEEPRIVKQEPRSVNHSLIQNFIKVEPGPIRADRKTSLKGDVSLSSVKEHDGFITDTLAKIYVKQGLVAKAIYAYEKLSLKYPEKSAYFAAQIEKVKNLNHS
jgi:hypothetical protein